MLGLVRGNGESIMLNPIKIDRSHIRAMLHEIGSMLRALLKEDQELPANLRSQLNRLRRAFWIADRADEARHHRYYGRSTYR